MLKHYTEDLTRGPLAKQILVFSIPLIFSNLLQVLFNMADLAVVGRFSGSLALGAVGSTSSLVFLYTGFLIGMAGGINVLTARHFGGKDERALRETVHTALLLCLVMGIILLLCGLLFSRPLLHLLNTKPELIDSAALYLKIYFLGMPAMALYNFGNAVFSAVGDTRRPLFYLSIAGVANVLLNLFFVVVCGMDVDGVAIATVISQYISAFLVVRALFRSTTAYGLRRSELRMSPHCCRALLGLGIPSGLQFAIFTIANLFTQYGLNTFDATIVSGSAAAGNAETLVFEVLAAFNTACGSFIGQNLGAKNKTRIKKSFFISLAYCVGSALLSGCLMLLFGPQFLSLFTKEAAVVEAGMYRITISACSIWISSIMDCTISASRGLGKTVVPTVILIFFSCIFRIIWIFTVFAHFGTITSLYLLYAFSWGLSSITEVAYFIHSYRKITQHL